MTEVHVRTYTEHRATLTTYDWQRRHYVQREHVRYVPVTQVVEFDDREPVTPWETRNMRAERLRAENTERVRDYLREHGPHSRWALRQALGISREVMYKIAETGLASGELVEAGRHHNRAVLGLPGQTYESKGYKPHTTEIRDALREHGAMTVAQMAAATGISEALARKLLKFYEGQLFEKSEREKRGSHRTPAIWAAIEQESD